jgi:hypothetical protein
MDKKLTFTGGEPLINFDDILRTPNATRDAFIEVFRAFGDNYIIQGITGDPSITAGYVMLDGEILKVDAHTKTGTHFAKVTTYEAGGDKIFNDSIPRQTWQKNRATITAGSGSLAYSGAKRMPNVLVDTITAGSSILAPANLPKATADLEGIREISTDAEAKALTATDKFLTPANLSAVNSGLLTKVIEIGNWNMDTTTTVSVAHGLDQTKIRGLSAIVRTDSGVVPFLHVNFGQDNCGLISADSTYVILSRVTGGVFDNANYDSTSYNRGWIKVEYVN